MKGNHNVIIKILPAEDCHPEYAPSKKVQEGMEFSGFLLLGFDEDEELRTAMIHGISVDNIAEGIKRNENDEVISVLRQSVAIAEGYIRAKQMHEELKKSRMTRDVIKSLRKALGKSDDEDEDDDEDDEEDGED